MTKPYIDLASDFSKQKLESLSSSLETAAQLIENKACVYATGSYGRLEAGPESDLDLFIVSVTGDKMEEGDEEYPRLLSGIEEIKLQYHLIQCVEDNGLPEFDGDGKYLVCHTFHGFVEYLGSREDDAKNTLTGRLLLLLESRPLLGHQIYEDLVAHVVGHYFRDFADNRGEFIPAFLFNDILRMWRTFCVNYEYNRKVGSSGAKIKNLKLKYSRMLTCYSALLILLHVHSMSGTVTPDDVKQMISKTPIERLKLVRDERSKAGDKKVESALDRALSEYSSFLEFTHQGKTEVLSQYESNSEKWRNNSYQFGALMEEAMSGVGRSEEQSSPLFRLVLI
ncbi:nucleotidyltransferase domain-containing protein [Sulfitobacter mediterraneus]|uniref:nucleotidyltransferase domain-containing protein n=1 Tax=Sulfitobacter mediterraneus TaxID=83219 RepID=UPI0021A6826C|nr:nucleotidyltransferase domain-containing protein [Sulfitobacter mediterraneus]UWR10890.1 nucleotidyltransferase domain-containing protein [Sulfitobacter mediterraneus]